MIGSSGGWVGLRFFLKKGEHNFARPPALGEEHIPRRWGGAQPQRGDTELNHRGASALDIGINAQTVYHPA